MITNKYRLIYEIPILCVIAMLLPGCSALKPSLSPKQIDKSPFTSIPCAAPCWQGLVIGDANESDVRSTLPNLTFIDQDSILLFQRTSMPNIDLDFVPGVGVIANCVTLRQQCLSLSVVDDVLTEVTLTLNYEISIDDAIGYLGNPDYVGYDHLGAEVIICGEFLIWRDKQLMLISTFKGHNSFEKYCGTIRDTGKIIGSSLVEEVRYTSSAAIESALSTSTGEYFEFSGTIHEKE